MLKEGRTMEKITYQFYTPTQSPAEITVTEVLGIHVLPTIQNNWLNTLTPKAFVGWLQLLSLAINEENKVREGEEVQYPTKSELLNKLDIAESTFNKNILKPLFEYGLLTVEDVPGSERLNKRGLPNRRIIVYRYPLNKKENLLKPLTKIFDYESDYNSKAKQFGILGSFEKKKKQVEVEIMKEYERVMEESPNVNLVEKQASNSRSNTYPQASSFESNIYPQASSFRSNDNINTLRGEKLRELEALDIYNNTNNSLYLLGERENKINNIYNMQQNFGGIETEQANDDIYTYMNTPKEFFSEYNRLVIEKLDSFQIDKELKKDIVIELLKETKLHGDQIASMAASDQLDFMLKKIGEGEVFASFLAYFQNGLISRINSLKLKEQTSNIKEQKNESLAEPSSHTARTVFYNWLDERE